MEGFDNGGLRDLRIKFLFEGRTMLVKVFLKDDDYVENIL